MSYTHRAVRLAWCRIHNSEFQQPRRSLRALEVSGPSDLQFLGRTVDSLTFSVANGVAPSGYSDTSAPGFRYDLATDNAIVLPQVVAPTSLPTFLSPSNLPAYPYFVFDAPGEPLFPLSPFSPALAIAGTLRSHCRFEAALAWYRQAFDPLQRDCTWIRCAGNTSQVGAQNAPASPVASTMNVPNAIRIPGEGITGGGACCDSTDISCEQARNRSVVLHYLESLVEWGDAVMRRGNSPEAFQQARLIFDTADMILGRIPSTVKLSDPSQSQQVSAFAPAFAPLNLRLLDLYEVVGDRLREIRACLNSRRLRDCMRTSAASATGIMCRMRFCRIARPRQATSPACRPLRLRPSCAKGSAGTFESRKNVNQYQMSIR